MHFCRSGRWAAPLPLLFISLGWLGSDFDKKTFTASGENEKTRTRSQFLARDFKRSTIFLVKIAFLLRYYKLGIARVVAVLRSEG